MKRNPSQHVPAVVLSLLCLSAGVLLGRYGIPEAQSVTEASAELLPLSAFDKQLSGAEASLRDGKYFASSSRQWSYIAMAELGFGKGQTEPCTIRIHGTCNRGKMGFVVLGHDRQTVICEEDVSAAADFEVRLPVPIPSEAACLVLRSHAPEGEVSEAVIETVSIQPDPSLALDPSIVTSDKLEAAGDYWLGRFLDERVISRLGGEPTDWEIVRALCDWVYQTVPTSASKEFTLDASGYDVYSSPLSYQCHILDTLGGAYYCGGQATLLRRLVGLYGYPAASLALATPGGQVTHVATLAVIDHDGNEYCVVLDPYFNYALADEDSQPISVLEAIERIRDGAPESVRRLRGNRVRKRLFVAEKEGPLNDIIIRNYEPTIIKRSQSHNVYSAAFDEIRYLRCFESSGRLTTPLALRLVREDWNYILLHPLDIYTDNARLRALLPRLQEAAAGSLREGQQTTTRPSSRQ